jgi:uncharacterized membrane protein
MSHHRDSLALLVDPEPVRRSPSSAPRVIGALTLLGGAAWIATRLMQPTQSASGDAERVLATVKKPQEVYDLFRNPERLKTVMPMLEGVAHDGDRVTWTFKMGDTRQTLELRLEEDRPGEGMTWTAASSDAPRFRLSLGTQVLPFDRGTAMRLRLESDPATGTLFGKVAKQGLQAALLSARALLEAGEVPTTEGQPRGSGGMKAAQALSGGAA